MGVYRVEDNAMPIEAMCDRALLALRSVKKNFTQRYCVYEEKMRQSAMEEQQIVDEMEKALEQNEFKIYLQPQYHQLDMSFFGAEALVRWEHPTKGMISPGKFIPILEKNEYITVLDKYVLEEACKMQRDWLDKGLDIVPISINLSRRDMFKENLVSSICNIVDFYELDHKYINFEITESAFVEGHRRIIEVVEKIREQGFEVEMDDFGSGYSSLNALQDVPVDVLKLDMKFLMGDDENSKKSMILESVVRMVHQMGMKLIAEGVETVKQADYLRSIGCFFLQGFLFDRPMPVEEFEEKLRSTRKSKNDEKMLETYNSEIDYLSTSKESLAFFNNLIGGAGIIELDGDTIEIVRYNDEYLKFMNLEEFEPGGHNFKDCFAKSEWERFLKAVKKAIKTLEVTECKVNVQGCHDVYRSCLFRFRFKFLKQVMGRALLCFQIEPWDKRCLLESILKNSGQDEKNFVQNLLKYTGMNLGADRCYIFEKKRNFDNNTYEWVKEGVEPEIDNLQGISSYYTENWYSSFSEGKMVIIENLESIKDEEPGLYELLKVQGIHSIVVGPFLVQGEVMGFIGVDNPSKELLEDAADTIRLLSYYVQLALRKDKNYIVDNRFWELYEDMDGYCYASKISTNEIVFMNKKLREVCGVEKDGYKGEMCYKLIQGRNEVCEFCNNQYLLANKFDDWGYYNKYFKKYAKVIDALVEIEGEKYRFEINFDITEAKKEAEMVEKLRNVERITNECFKYALEEDEPEECLNRVLEYMGEVNNADRAYIFEIDERGYSSNTYEWCAEGISSEIDALQELPPEVCAIWYDHFKSGEVVIIRNLENIKESDPLMYQTLKPQGIHSLVVVPLFEKNEAIGFYGIDNPPAEAIDMTEDTLEIMSNFIVSLLRRRDLFSKLNAMSYSDSLTGLGNRHALYGIQEHLIGRKNLGVLYCDLNGLKHVNDTEGHLAGDRFILDACNLMKKQFKGDKLYRVGGDEFVIFVSDCSKEILENRVQVFKDNLKQENINMAVGYAWTEELIVSPDLFASSAEKMMYQEKKKWYEEKNK